MVPGPCAFILDICKARVNLRIQVSEALCDRFDRLEIYPGLRIFLLRQLRIARLHRFCEGFGLQGQIIGLFINKCFVVLYSFI
ncbi:hypothetical protein D3C86_2113770 [compost metagenome]